MYQKKGFPEKDDLVVCTVKNILASSVIADLDEYEKKEGMIHVSEIARKWVRNLRTYMKVGTKVVCKIMEVRPSENFISLSVRRVGAAQHRNKMSDWASEKKANDILEVFAKQAGINTKTLYDEIGNKILDKFGLLYPFFMDISREGEKVLLDIGVEKNLAKQLAELIQKRIVIPKAVISGTLTMQSAAPNGLEVIENAMAAAKQLSAKKQANFELKYLGAPKYRFKLIAEDFKIAEETLKEISVQLSKLLEANEGSAEFKRDD